jgi:hypothetical protein
MFSNDPPHNFSDTTFTPDIDPSYASVDLNQDGQNNSYSQSFDADGDGQYDSTMIQVDSDGDGIAETIHFADIDTDGDGQLDRTTINMDGDGNSPDAFTVDVPYINEPNTIGESSLPTTCDAPVIGNPEDDMQHWHQQNSDNTCAVACQEFILNDLAENSGFSFTENQLVEEATSCGWFNGGTSKDNMGNLLEAHGIPVERNEGATLDDLAHKLDRGEKVMVALDADEIWYESNILMDDFLGDIHENSGSIPGQDANHAVQVIGIDRTDPNQPKVILNDPGHPGGCGVQIPADKFENAWNDSNNYIVSTTIHSTPSQTAVAESPATNQPIVAGSYDREGNWWWSDGSVEPNYNWKTGYV